MTTWRDYADRLEPDEIAEFEWVDAHPTHRNGPEGHRLGQIAVAQMYIARRMPWWRKLI